MVVPDIAGGAPSRAARDRTVKCSVERSTTARHVTGEALEKARLDQASLTGLVAGWAQSAEWARDETLGHTGSQIASSVKRGGATAVSRGGSQGHAVASLGKEGYPHGVSDGRCQGNR